MPELTTAAIAAVLVLVSAPIVRVVLARARIVDVPNSRSSHTEATTRGGGIAVALGSVVAMLLSSQLVGARRNGLLVVALGMGLIGLVDDLRQVDPLPRLVAQAVVAFAGVGWLCQSIHGALAWKIGFSLGVFVWIVAYVNAFNFMDGINGISVAQVVIAGMVWWLLGVTQDAPALAAAGIIVAAAGAAFLPFNVPRARMFLGDIGSYFLGSWLAVTAVIGLRYGLAPEAVLAPLSLYGADTLTTLIRRMRRGDPLSHAHREHVYQRLVQSGWSHSQTAVIVGLAITVCSGLGALSLTDSMTLRVLGDVVIGLVLLLYVTNPRARRWLDETGAGVAQPS
jgi:UDP-GlcNAc:undecaprenyl-phosphate GlcNAc-1-phosphate transferase